MKKILVTGGGGFLGARLVRRALGAGLAVAAVGRRADPVRLHGLEGVLTYRVLDLVAEGALTAAARNYAPDVIIHAATAGVSRARPTTLREMLRVNVLGALEVARAAREARASVVWIGSCFEYAPSNELLSEDAPLEPASDYGFAKIMGWRAFMRAAGSEVVHATLRPFHLYGPGEDTMRVVPAMLLAVLGRAENLFGDEMMVRDLTFVDDVADATLKAGEALTRGALQPGTALNVCTGKGTNLGDLGRFAAEVAGAPDFVHTFVGVPPVAGYDPTRLVGDPRRARTVLSWTATTPLKMGLAASCDALETP